MDLIIMFVVKVIWEKYFIQKMLISMVSNLKQKGKAIPIEVHTGP